MCDEATGRVVQDLGEEDGFIERVLATSPNLVYVYDVIERRMVYANRELGVLLGDAPPQMRELGPETLPALLHPDDQWLSETMYRQLDSLGEGQVFECEYRVRRSNGQWRWLHDRRTVFARTAEGKLRQFRGATADVTDRKLMEEKLRLTQFAVDCAGDAVFWIDAAARLVYVNDAACQSLGYSRDELLRMTVFDIDPIFPREKWPPEWENVRQRGSLSFESLHRRKSGESFPVSLTVNFVQYAGAEYHCAYARDITERKQADQQLLEKNRFLNNVLESLTHPFYVIDAHDYTIKLANSAARVGEIGPLTTCYSLTHRSAVPCDTAGHACPLAEVKATGKPTIVEHVHYDREGNARTYEVHAYPIFDESGEVAQIIEYNLDVTEARKAQEAMRRAKADADAANAAKDHFLAVLSHELRTPLTPVLALASILEKDRRLPRDVLDDLSTMRRNVELEARLIDDLLDLTRIARGKMELRPQTFDLAEVLRHALDICAPEIDAKDLRVEMGLRETNLWLAGDASRMQQVFWNLLKNAIKFTPRNGCIGVHAYGDEQGRIVVEVIDSGVGIEPEVLPRIFDAFEQGGRSITRDFGGLGLGLAISKALVEMHGGTISAESEGRGKGATLRVLLPATAAPPRPPTREPSADGAAAVARRSGRKLRLLLVEDHVDTARIITQLLRVLGYEVLTAQTMASAEQLLGRESFDLIVSDLGLPDGSGLDLMRRARQSHPGLKGIALSGYGMDEDMARSRAAGFVEHLTKPVNFDRLREAIAQIA